MNEVACPKCGSKQVSANKKGFSVGKAAAGAILTGGIGLVAGAHGSSDVEITCLACGNVWEPKKLSAQTKQAEQIQQYKDNKEWKRDFYAAYKAGNTDKALSIYNSKFPGEDVDKAYTGTYLITDGLPLKLLLI